MKRITKAVFIAIAALSSIILASCENYPEGVLSFHSSEYRIVNVWQVSNTYKNGEKITNTEHAGFAPGSFYYIYADHILRVLAVHNGEIRESTFATWILDTKSKTVEFNYTLVGKRYHFTADIRKLSRREFTIEFNDENNDHWRLELFSRVN
ncbi:MAG: hypothetical protein SPL42_07035 [Bacteroidales bacterium]|nr:hypothetical protein [Bacteroidales bacterium]